MIYVKLPVLYVHRRINTEVVTAGYIDLNSWNTRVDPDAAEDIEFATFYGMTDEKEMIRETIFVKVAQVYIMECGITAFEMIKPRVPEIASDRVNMSPDEVIHQLFLICTSVRGQRSAVKYTLEAMRHAAVLEVMAGRKRRRTVPESIGKIVRRCFEIKDATTEDTVKIAVHGRIVKYWGGHETTDRKRLWKVVYDKDGKDRFGGEYELDSDTEDLYEDEVRSAIIDAATEKKVEYMTVVRRPDAGTSANAIPVDD